MKFSIHYCTRFGESLVLEAGREKFPMTWEEGNIWTVNIPKPSAEQLANYGYLVVEDGLVTRTEWTRHSAKKAAAVVDSWIDCPIEGCPFTRKHSNPLFDKPGFRGAGTAVPVFSLRSEEGFGIGEFLDLKEIVDWAARTGQCIIQLLPVNDTTRKGDWKDSYPYNPISSFALNPMYINLQALGVKADASFKKARKALNASAELDYPAVFKAKTAYMRQAFEDKGRKEIGSAAFKKFVSENEVWLEEYAAFCAKRDGNEPEFHKWIQFHLDKQFGGVVDYARGKGVCFKGDLPIGVSADSAEAYYHPQIFNLDSSAGAPPDFFSQDGQNWGFPTYNWEAMAGNDYAWWKARLRKMSRYFDAFRIDHILGFFRIWEIPLSEKSGKFGHFNPAIPYLEEEILSSGLPIRNLFHEDPRKPGFYQPLISPDTSGLEDWQKELFGQMYNDFYFHRNDEFWRRNAEKKLPALLGATGMLACGEDLGMVPDCVNGVMAHERILSLEMACMDKGRPWPYLSVCATSSHDMETLRMQKAREWGRDPEPWEVRRELWNHVNSSSMLAIFPLQDWLALDGGLRRSQCAEERINEPANPEHHWRYRMHINVKTLNSGEASQLNAEIEGLIKDSGRFTS